MTQQYEQRDINDGDPNLGSIREVFQFFDDFMGRFFFSGAGSFTPIGTENWRATIAGAGEVLDLGSVGVPPSSVQIADHNGQAVLRLTAAPADGVFLSQNDVIMAGTRWECMVNLVTPAAIALEEFFFAAGIGGSFTGGAVLDGFALTFDITVSPNWLAITDDTAGAGGTTAVDTGIPIVANTWVELGAQLATDLSRCNFFINDALVASITTTLPTNPGQFGTGIPTIAYDRNGGVVTGVVDSLVDYFYMIRTISR